jgi:hypothetical protein
MWRRVVYKWYPSRLDCQGKNIIVTCIEASSSTTLGRCLMTVVAALRDTVDRPPLIYDVWWSKDAWHDVVALVIPVLTVDVRVGLFKDDESWHQISWYKVNCTLLLISLLAWVLEMLGCLGCYLWPIDLFVHFLWVSASIVDSFCGTRLISLCFIAEVVVWQVHTKPWIGIA